MSSLWWKTPNKILASLYIYVLLTVGWFLLFWCHFPCALFSALLRKFLEHLYAALETQSPEYLAGRHAAAPHQRSMHDLPAYFPRCTEEEMNREGSQSAKVPALAELGHHGIPPINFSGGVNAFGLLMSHLETMWIISKHFHCFSAYFPYEVAFDGQGICML